MMNEISGNILFEAARFLVYGGLLAFLTVKTRQGAEWTKKLAVRVTTVFAVLKALGGLVSGFLYLAWQQDLFHKAEEAYRELTAIPETVIQAITSVYFFAMILLGFMYLGNLKKGK